MLGLVPGCLPAILQQERNNPTPTITVTGVRPNCPPLRLLPEPKPREMLVNLPREQEPPPRITTQRLAAPDPGGATEPSEPVKPAQAGPMEKVVAPPPPDPALVAAVRAYLDGDLALARQHLGKSRSAPTVETQEQLLSLLIRLQEQDLERLPTAEADRLLGTVEWLTRTMQSRAPLVLEQLCFCRRIKTFGIYDPLPGEPRFQAGVHDQPGERVCVYAEVRNVAACHEGSLHVVALDGTLEILNASDKVVFRTDFPATPDRSRSRRTDCYVGYEFNVPAKLPPGSYKLRVQVRDLARKEPRQAGQTLKFTVVEATALGSR